MFIRNFLACATLLGATGACLAQSSEPRDAWLARNYRFTGPSAGGTQTADPVSELEDIQRTVLAILRKANFAGDYEAALAASAQAAANVQLKATLAAHKQSAQTSPATAPEPAHSWPVMTARRTYTARPAQNPDAQAH